MDRKRSQKNSKRVTRFPASTRRLSIPSRDGLASNHYGEFVCLREGTIQPNLRSNLQLPTMHILPILAAHAGMAVCLLLDDYKSTRTIL
mmetsp:Transcript_16713/g.45836  ORF Transcript_16713/g.45836 Transcript_16713/m.45836 type:complete len:89 (+) Transcript_16713:835-1101(+)